MPEPLEGLQVLDLTRLLPGGVCTLLLADLGAQIIKVEDPHGGDYARGMEPSVDGQGAAFLAMNRNKRSLILDLKAQRGQSVFKKVAEHADVLIEGFRPGVMARLGLGWDICQGINPRLVYCSISGWGQDGPLAQHSAHDLNYVGATGMHGTMTTPQPLGGQIADVGGAYVAVMGILAALFKRERTGQGSYVDVSLAEAALPFALYSWVEALATGQSEGPTSLTGGLACYAIYVAKDGRHIALAALEAKFWANFCRAVGRPDLALGDHREPTRQGELKGALTALFASRPATEWQDLLGDADCCFSLQTPAGKLAEVAHFQSRGSLGLFAGGRPWMRSPLRLSDNQPSISPQAPGYGEHSREILHDAGYSDAEIDDLVAARVVK